MKVEFSSLLSKRMFSNGREVLLLDMPSHKQTESNGVSSGACLNTHQGIYEH